MVFESFVYQLFNHAQREIYKSLAKLIPSPVIMKRIKIFQNIPKFALQGLNKLIPRSLVFLLHRLKVQIQ